MTRGRPGDKPDATATTPSDGVLVGVVGLGNMGSEIAARLASSWQLRGYDIDASRRDNLQARGATAVSHLEQLADADVILLSLPTQDASEVVVRELAPLVRRDVIVVQTSTVNPHDVRNLRSLPGAQDLRIVDAAVLSGVAQMRRGEGAIMAGGAAADIDEVADLLNALSVSWSHVGQLGAAMAAKVIHNAVIHAVMVVLVEAGALAVANSVDNRTLAHILADLERGLMRPLTHRFVERILGGDLEGGMPLEAARKDSTLVLELAELSGVPLFAMQSTHTVYEIAESSGLGRQDYAAISRLWEQWLDFTFSS